MFVLTVAKTVEYDTNSAWARSGEHLIAPIGRWHEESRAYKAVAYKGTVNRASKPHGDGEAEFESAHDTASYVGKWSGGAMTWGRFKNERVVYEGRFVGGAMHDDAGRLESATESLTTQTGPSSLDFAEALSDAFQAKQFRYIGAFRSNVFHGDGQFSTPGFTFAGAFDAGHPTGRGVASFNNGVRLSGEWCQGLPAAGKEAVVQFDRAHPRGADILTALGLPGLPLERPGRGRFIVMDVRFGANGVAEVAARCRLNDNPLGHPLCSATEPGEDDGNAAEVRGWTSGMSYKLRNGTIDDDYHEVLGMLKTEDTRQKLRLDFRDFATAFFKWATANQLAKPEDWPPFPHGVHITCYHCGTVLTILGAQDHTVCTCASCHNSVNASVIEGLVELKETGSATQFEKNSVIVLHRYMARLRKALEPLEDLDCEACGFIMPSAQEKLRLLLARLKQLVRVPQSSWQLTCWETLFNLDDRVSGWHSAFVPLETYVALSTVKELDPSKIATGLDLLTYVGTLRTRFPIIRNQVREKAALCNKCNGRPGNHNAACNRLAAELRLHASDRGASSVSTVPLACRRALACERSVADAHADAHRTLQVSAVLDTLVTEVARQARRKRARKAPAAAPGL